MTQTQVLSTGQIIRQDFADAIRPVFFQTDHEEFQYATHGGTLFIARLGARDYGLTCGHVFGDFAPGAMFIPGDKHAQKGCKPARIKAVAHPSSPRAGAVDTDIEDIFVIEFAEDIAPGFFDPGAYVIDLNTIATSQLGHKLLVAGVLKDKTTLLPPDISVGYCRLEFRDAGASESDPILRKAVAEFADPAFQRLTGISGSPVFDLTANALCGMAIRGGMTGNRCTLHYVDIFDIVRFLQAVSERAESAYYTKTMLPGG